jgi:hypothetical protein
MRRQFEEWEIKPVLEVHGAVERMLRHDNILVYGPKETFGIYKNMGGRVVYFTIPTAEARQRSRRKVVGRKVYTDFLHSPNLKKISRTDFQVGLHCIRAEARALKLAVPEIYLGNRTNRYRRILQSLYDM